MAKYKIEFKASAVRELRAFQRQDLQRLMQVIGALADDPRPPGSKKLCDDEKYRVRCGNFRILYAVHDDILIIFIVKVAHRKDVYR